MMELESKTSRRDFLKIAATAGGGLMLGFHWHSSEAADMASVAAHARTTFNSYLTIAPDGTITLFSPNPELGQNVKTSFPMIVAEELDADWRQVKVLQAPLDGTRYERQLTGGSGAIPHSWERLRKAGATARRMLIEAAAKKLGVPPSSLSASSSIVMHEPTGRKFTYGELAAEAATIPVPAEVKLKDPKDFNLIGTAVRNVDNHDMFTGKPLYGIDVVRDGMLIAMVQRPPAFGSTIRSVDDAAVKAMPGIVDVVVYDNNVAIVGHTTWQVMKARRVLKVEYENEKPLESSSDHDQLFRDLLDNGEATIRRQDGDVTTAFANAAKVIKAEYQCPFLAHAPLEPMNFFAHVRADGIELIGPTQTPDRARGDAARITGIAPEKITLELTRLGGGFGRRLQSDYAVDAIEISRRLRKPIKVIWTREDDMTGGSYRPAVRYRFEAALDKDGNMVGYKLRGVGINAGNSTREHNFPSGAVDHLRIEYVDYRSPITTGAWRAPITNFLAFAEQSFLDEVAHAAGRDPVGFRLSLLNRAKQSPVGEIRYNIDRMIEVIKVAAEKAQWGKKTGVAQGFSVYFSHRSYVAQVAEITLKDDRPVLGKIYAAADCGIVINRTGAEQQVRGGIVDGLGHALYGQLTFKDGAPQQRNFNNYRLIRMKEVPEIDVFFIDNGIDPTGLGEPALPPTGAAVANALFQATGARLRDQPFLHQEGMKGVDLGRKM